MDERKFATRDQWEPLTMEQLTAPELLDGARRSSGPVEAYRVRALVAGKEEYVEAFWVERSQRAAVASSQGVFWTNASSPLLALRAWVADAPSGVRTEPR